MGKLRVGLVFGGRSGEHEVSLMSAESVLGALDKERYDIVLVGIGPSGQWLAGDGALAALQGVEGHRAVPVAPMALPGRGGRFQRLTPSATARGASGAVEVEDFEVDVFFPVLHGPYGEDGTIQGLFELADVPYVGCGVAASAAGMDKALMKALFEHAGLPVLPYVVLTDRDWAVARDEVRARVAERCGYPCFVKPANLGSSVGISRVATPEQLDAAVAEALRHDRKALVERAATDCREVEVSVLGNDEPEASIPGEIRPAAEFYDYHAKYHDDRSQLVIPADLSAEAAAAVRRHALAAFSALDGSGLARVDFFVHKETERIWVNEINTMPGFTRISMYPKLWEASGLPYPQLIDRLIELGLERHAARRRRAAAWENEGR